MRLQDGPAPADSAGTAPEPARHDRLAVLVMAAGLGSRIARTGGSRPKWLLEVAGRPIADHQLAALTSADSPVDRVVAVTGYAADTVDAYLAAGTWSVPVRTVRNERYDQRNNWLTLAVGLAHLHEEGWTGPIAVLNSDFVPGGDLVPRFLQAAGGTAYDALLAVDDVRPLTDEAMKVAAVQRPDGELALTGIGKVGVAPAVGEYIGLAGLRGPGVAAMARVLAEHEDDPARHDRWYDLAFADLAGRGLDVRCWRTGPARWVEVDDDADLAAAQDVPGSSP